MARFWESETAVAVEPGAEAELEPRIAPDVDAAAKIREEAPAPSALTLSAGDFAALEERILRAVALVKQERQARLAAEARAAEAEAQLTQAKSGNSEQTARIEQMETELASLKTERDQVRQRVERLLEQLDSLEL